MDVKTPAGTVRLEGKLDPTPPMEEWILRGPGPGRAS